MNTSNGFGERLKALRKSRGVTQQELSDALGISRPQVTNMEDTAALPKGERINALAAFFGVPADYFLVATYPQEKELGKIREFVISERDAYVTLMTMGGGFQD